MYGRIKRITLGVAAVAGLAVASGVIYEQWSRWNIARTYPPPGELIEVGGHKLHLNCTGSGSPTVVLVHGYSPYGSVSWILVQPELAKHYRVCSYDRPGILWSEESIRMPTGIGNADALYDVLKSASEPPPYLMVGHSSGGPLIWTFADRYPDETAGLVFVDSSHPDIDERLEEVYGPEPDYYAVTIWERIRLRALIETGMYRMFYVPPVPHVSEANVALKYWPYSVSGLRAGWPATPRILADTPRAPNFDHMPVIVLSSERQINGPTAEEAADMSAEEIRLGRGFGRVWLELHEEIAALSARSDHRIVADADHRIAFDAPADVIRAIQDAAIEVGKTGQESAVRRRVE